MPYLISFVWGQLTCQERVESDKIQNEKFLPTVGPEPTILRFVAWSSTDRATRALIKAEVTFIHTWSSHTNVRIPVHLCKFEDYYEERILYMYVHVLYCVTFWINLYVTNSKTTHKSCFVFNMQNTTKKIRFGRVLHVESIHRTCGFIYCHLSNTEKYVTQYSALLRCSL